MIKEIILGDQDVVGMAEAYHWRNHWQNHWQNWQNWNNWSNCWMNCAQ